MTVQLWAIIMWSVRVIMYGTDPSLTAKARFYLFACKASSTFQPQYKEEPLPSLAVKESCAN